MTAHQEEASRNPSGQRTGAGPQQRLHAYWPDGLGTQAGGARDARAQAAGWPPHLQVLLALRVHLHSHPADVQLLLHLRGAVGSGQRQPKW